MKNIKKVSNREMIDSLNISLSLNDKALDYIENVLNRANDRLKYNENDPDYKDTIEVLEYIKISLTYLGVQYNESLVSLGGKNGFFRKS